MDIFFIEKKLEKEKEIIRNIFLHLPALKSFSATLGVVREMDVVPYLRMINGVNLPGNGLESDISFTDPVLCSFLVEADLTINDFTLFLSLIKTQYTVLARFNPTFKREDYL